MADSTTAAAPRTRLDAPILEHAATDFVTLLATDSVGRSLDKLRSGAAVAERIVYFYAVDAGGVLVGVVPTRRLLMSSAERSISDLMIRNVVTLPRSATVGSACDVFLKHRFLAIPVVDDAGRIVAVADVGLFTDDIQNAIERRAENDVFQLIGLHVEAGRKASPLAGFLTRFPWLLCNIGGGLACAVVAGFYETFLAQAVVISLFVPVVLALSESVSIQAMTLTLQKLHGNRPDGGGGVKAMAAEAVTAGLLGVGCGSLVGLAAWLWRGQADVALVIALTIAAAMVTACMLGVALPTVVRMLRGDPKIAAGPIVLAAGDIVTLVFYFKLGMSMVSPTPA